MHEFILETTGKTQGFSGVPIHDFPGDFKAKVGQAVTWSLGAKPPLSSSSHRALSLCSPSKQQCLTVLCMSSAGKEGEYEAHDGSIPTKISTPIRDGRPTTNQPQWAM
jgi:hypothetical protein